MLGVETKSMKITLISQRSVKMKAIVTPKQDGIAKASKSWKAQEMTV